MCSLLPAIRIHWYIFGRYSWNVKWRRRCRLLHHRMWMRIATCQMHKHIHFTYENIAENVNRSMLFCTNFTFELALILHHSRSVRELECIFSLRLYVNNFRKFHLWTHTDDCTFYVRVRESWTVCLCRKRKNNFFSVPSHRADSEWKRPRYLLYAICSIKWMCRVL